MLSCLKKRISVELYQTPAVKAGKFFFWFYHNAQNRFPGSDHWREQRLLAMPILIVLVSHLSLTNKSYHLNQLQALETRPKAAARLTRNSKIFKVIIKALQEKKAEKIVSLDLRKIPEAIADFFIVCEAATNIQVKGIGDYLQDEVKKECNEIPFKHEGYQHAKWVLVDYVNIVVHILQPETRKFYKLEDLWSDGQLTEHDEEKPKAGSRNAI